MENPVNLKEIFMMAVVGQVETSSVPKRLKCMYKKPGTITALIPYWENFIELAKTDSLFATLLPMLNTCETEVGKLDTAEKAAMASIGTGKATARNIQYLKTEIQMEKPLGVIQAAADEMTTAEATELFQRFQLKIDERHGRSPNDEDVVHGKTSGTLDVKHKKIDATTTYLTMISTDKEKWYVGDWGKNLNGTITEIDEKPLTPGTLYYVRTRTNGKDGKSDWGTIFEIYCL